MKTMYFTFILMVCILCSSLSGENVRIYPIPSYNVLVETSALFQENIPGNCKARRKINVHINTSSKPDSIPCIAEVYIYSLDHQDVLGPYYVNCGETLSVEIDDREWGTTVTTTIPVEVSVWIDLLGEKKNSDKSFLPETLRNPGKYDQNLKP
jgi:hypothetical protein